MLIRRNAVEVWHIARIKKRDSDLFLEKIDTLKVSYVTTSLKIHTIKSFKQVYPKQNTRNTTGYISKVDGRGPHGNQWCEYRLKTLVESSMMSSRILTPQGASIVVWCMRVERRLSRSSSITGFTTESDQIRKIQTFSNLQSSKLCTSHILVFGCLHGQDVVGS